MKKNKIKILKTDFMNINLPYDGTELNGLFTLPVLARLSLDNQKFILHFVKSSDSLKDMTKYLD